MCRGYYGSVWPGDAADARRIHGRALVMREEAETAQARVTQRLHTSGAHDP
jgi:hypothetical protein